MPAPTFVLPFYKALPLSLSAQPFSPLASLGRRQAPAWGLYSSCCLCFYAGDLRELPGVPLRGEGSCGGGGAPRDSAGSGATEVGLTSSLQGNTRPFQPACLQLDQNACLVLALKLHEPTCGSTATLYVYKRNGCEMDSFPGGEKQTILVTSRISGSLSCGAREVRSPCAWRGGVRPGSRVTGGD